MVRTNESIVDGISRNVEAGNDDVTVTEDGHTPSSSNTKRARDEEHEDEPEPVMKRFRIISSEDQFKLSLPEDMADYENTHCQRFIPDKDINESILLNKPVPSNINVPQ